MASPKELKMLKMAAAELVGPIVIGAMLNLNLHGILMMQCYEYYQRFRKTDSAWIRGLVAGSFVISTISAAFAAHCAYYYGVISFGNMEKILYDTPEFGTLVTTICISAAPVQVFFGWRARTLTGQSWLLWFCIVSALFQIGGGSAVIVLGTRVEDFRKFYTFKGLVVAWLVLACTTDILITCTLVNYLTRNKTGVPATDDILRRVTRMVVQTGAITTATAFTAMALFLGVNNNSDFMVNIPMPVLYANCLMSSLNARGEWIKDDDTMTMNVTRTAQRNDWGLKAFRTTDVETGLAVTQSDIYVLPSCGTGSLDSTLGGDKSCSSGTADVGVPANSQPSGSDVKS